MWCYSTAPHIAQWGQLGCGRGSTGQLSAYTTVLPPICVCIIYAKYTTVLTFIPWIVRIVRIVWIVQTVRIVRIVRIVQGIVRIVQTIGIVRIVQFALPRHTILLDRDCHWVFRGPQPLRGDYAERVR